MPVFGGFTTADLIIIDLDLNDLPKDQLASLVKILAKEVAKAEGYFALLEIEYTQTYEELGATPRSSTRRTARTTTTTRTRRRRRWARRSSPRRWLHSTSLREVVDHTNHTNRPDQPVRRIALISKEIKMIIW